MRPRLVSVGITLTVVLGCLWTSSLAAQDLTSSAEGRKDVSLTIYNNDLSLLREQRSVPVENGTFRLRFEDVTSGIDPTTVHLQALSGGPLQIIEQNYEYDLISRAKLMEKYVGREVGYRMEDGALGRARLLSVHDGDVYQLGEKIVFELPGSIVLDAIPEELSARPTLVWTLEANRKGQRDVEVTYLSTGFSWRADYVLLLEESEARGGLTGWVTIDNQSGGSFENAALQLVAGDVNRVRDVLRPRILARTMQYEAEPQFDQETLFEYHLYTLQRRTDLKNNQKKQILFFDADEVAVSKAYTFRGLPQSLNPNYVAPQGSERVSVTLRLENTRENGLGLPIPKGVVRVYKRDSRGANQFLGENRVEHTPKDERLEFDVGRAFDIVGEHIQTEYRRLAERAFEVAFEVKLRNHKQEDIEVSILEVFTGDWTIVESSHTYQKIDAQTAEFRLAVAADSEASLTYRVRVQP